MSAPDSKDGGDFAELVAIAAFTIASMDYEAGVTCSNFEDADEKFFKPRLRQLVARVGPRAVQFALRVAQDLEREQVNKHMVAVVLARMKDEGGDPEK